MVEHIRLRHEPVTLQSMMHSLNVCRKRVQQAALRHRR